MKVIILALLSIAFCLTASAVDAPKGFNTASLNIGYIRDQDFGARVAVPELVDYVKRLQAICTEFFIHATTAENLDIVVAVKPGQESRIWFISSLAPTPAEQRDQLRVRLEAAIPPKVSGGPIAFAIEGRIAGGDLKVAKRSDAPPTPNEWTDALSKQNRSMQFDEMLQLVWPTPAPLIAASAPAATVPTEFVTQVLEPTGGKVPRPKEWFYTEGHHGKVYMWTLSREDTSGNRPYTTGFRIQLFSEIKKNTGKTAKEFVLDFIAKKKKEAAKVIRIFEEQNQGLFSRVGIEMEEGPHHIVYSVFWGNNDLDLAVITIAGTTKELWRTYAPAFDKMNNFESIDMKRFEKQDTFTVPEGIKYKEATAEVNERAKQLLLTKFSGKAMDKDVLSMFEKKLICGPGLWREIKDDKTLSKLDKGKVTFVVNTDKLEGKLFQSPNEILLFWKAFSQRTDLAKFKIRKLTQEELKIYWAMISFDIEEPIFVLESERHKILVLFASAEASKILWIDDFQNIHMKK